MLDVGQGLAVVVRTQTHALVYDAGPAFPTGRDAGELAVLPYLRHRGVRQRRCARRQSRRSRSSGRSEQRARRLAGRTRCWQGRRSGRCRGRARRAGAASAGRGTACSSRSLHPARFSRARATTIRRASCSYAAPPAACCSPATWKQPPSRKLSTAACRVRRSSSCLITAAARLRPRRSLPHLVLRSRWFRPDIAIAGVCRGVKSSSAGAPRARDVLTTADSGAIEITFAAGRPPLAREYRQHGAALLASLTDGAPLSATMTRITRPAQTFTTAHSCSKS